MHQDRQKYYPDITLFLIAIPLISAFNYYLTYSNIKFNWFLVLTFTIDTVQGYAAWWAVRLIILNLDKKLPYRPKPIRRIVIQILTTTIAGLVIISLLTECVSWIAKGKPAALNFYTVDLFIISIWFFAINGVYIGLHYYRELQALEEKGKQGQKNQPGGFLVKMRKQELLIPYPNLAGFFVDGEYVAACTLEGKRHFVDQSLDQVEKILPADLFFRLNRQFILHRPLITGFKRIQNGKIQVLIAPNENFPPEITVSRTKAPAFKSWFRPE